MGPIRGKVVRPDGQGVGGVALELRNSITGFRANATAGADGSFRFLNVPFNPYRLQAKVPGFQPIDLSVEIRSPIGLDLKVELTPALTESVTVKAVADVTQLETNTSMSHIDIDKSYIATAPATVASRAMEQIITSTPGFAKDENGRYHFQGAHSQNEYVVDGQTISDQTGVTFSNSIDPGIAQSIEVVYGNVPAEFGEKIGAVINLATRSGLGAGPVKGEVLAGVSRFGTYEGGLSTTYGTEKFGLFASVDGSKSDRFLDPVNPGNLNNHGDTARGFLRLDWAPTADDSFRLTALLGQTHRGVPNTFTQEAAGQDERVRTNDQNLNFGWQHVMSGSRLFDVAVFGRFASFRLDPSAGDTPVTATSDRSLDNYGIQPTFTWTVGGHEFKVGGVYKRIPIDERFDFGLTDPTLNDPESPDYNPDLAPYDLTRGGAEFRFHQTRTGTYYAGFVQDDIHVAHFTANLGLRYDHNDLPVTDAQLEPRIGFAYYVKRTGTVLRASYNRVLFTPEYENILLSSSSQAAQIVPPAVQQSGGLGGGVLPVRSERQSAYDAGFQQRLGSKLRFDLDFWKRRSKFAGDQDQFLNTGAVFPLAFQGGDLHGWNARLDLAQVAGFRGFMSLGHTRAIYVAPPVGGLFLDQGALDSLAGGPFLIDHDQDLQLQSAVTYDIAESGFWVGANVRYDSGLVTDADPESLLADPDNAFAAPYVEVHSGGDFDPNRIKARTVWDFSAGVDLEKHKIPLSIQVDLLNAFDEKGVYNILSVFGGTHVIPPRTVAARVRYRF
ncbi:MAG: TonB-dependent receptor [Acidobacteriia bacterium]|nr:TonB-dependent receptor [Terriglobia bacterium]